MTLSDFIDNFGASLDKGDEDSAKDFAVLIQFEWDGQTVTIDPSNVRFNHNDREVIISGDQ